MGGTEEGVCVLLKCVLYRVGFFFPVVLYVWGRTEEGACVCIIY